MPRFKMKTYRSDDFRFYKLPPELELALRDFSKWSDDHLLHEQAATTPTTPLYHYTDATALEGILKNKHLWCFAHSDQSDKKEFSYSLDLAHAELTRIERDGDLLTGDLCRCIRSLVRENDLTKTFGFFLFSLSEARDLESQWKRYGVNGSGFQIGFAPGLFLPDDPLSPHADRNVVLGRVIYGDGASTAAHREVIEKAAEIYSRVGVANAGMILSDTVLYKRYVNAMAKELIARQLIWRSLTSKRDCFASESELRYVTLNIQERFDGKVQTLPNGRRYIKYPLALKTPSNVVEILVGPNAAPDAEDTVRALLARHGYGSVAVARSKKRFDLSER
jgi:hypothetical protein